MLKKIFLTLLYFTPIGYILNLFKLLDPVNSQGVFVHLGHDTPVAVYVKKNPTASDRIHWLTNGVLLVFQGYLAAKYYYDIDLIAVYAVVAILFGVVNVITAIFPKLQWNKSNLGASILLILTIISIFGIVAFTFFQKNNSL